MECLGLKLDALNRKKWFKASRPADTFFADPDRSKPGGIPVLWKNLLNGDAPESIAIGGVAARSLFKQQYIRLKFFPNTQPGQRSGYLFRGDNPNKV